MMYADDGWIDGTPGPQAFRRPTVNPGLNDKQRYVDKWWAEKVPQSDHPSLLPYLESAIYLRQERPTGEGPGKCVGIVSRGRRRAAAERSQGGFRERKNKNATRICGEYEMSARWGTVFGTDEYRSTEVGMWELPFEFIDFGGSLEMNTSLQKKLNIGASTESGKCTILALETGVEWIAQGQPKRYPHRQRIDVLARGVRMGDISGGGTGSRTGGRCNCASRV